MLMLLAWAVLAPTGVVLASLMRGAAEPRRALLFKAHVACQSLGCLLTLVGFVYARTQLPSKWDDLPHHHGGLGAAVLGITLAQALVAVVRPAPGASLQRTLWERAHVLTGVGLLVLALATTLVGIQLLAQYNGESAGPWYAALVMGLLLTLGVGEGTVQWRRCRQKGRVGTEGRSAEMEAELLQASEEVLGSDEDLLEG